MYGIKQEAVISYDNIVENLSSSDYFPIPTTFSMWHNDTKNEMFCLCVDSFGISILSDEYTHHLLTLLQKYYAVTVDMEGKHFCDLKFDWNHEAIYANTKTPNYVYDVFYSLQHTTITTTLFPTLSQPNKLYIETPACQRYQII